MTTSLPRLAPAIPPCVPRHDITAALREMCIRDRFLDDRRTAVVELLAVDADEADAFVPVSYTHLDVYKRQFVYRHIVLYLDIVAYDYPWGDHHVLADVA